MRSMHLDAKTMTKRRERGQRSNASLKGQTGVFAETCGWQLSRQTSRDLTGNQTTAYCMRLMPLEQSPLPFSK